MGFEIKKKSGGSSDTSTKEKPPQNTEKNPFLKSGTAAKAMMEKDEIERQNKMSMIGKAWRFWIKPGEDATITFLDGEIDPNTGILDIPYSYEHMVKVAGKWENITCIEDQEQCPLCAAGENRSFVGYMTVLDHRGYDTEENGKKKHVEVARRLFVAKQATLKQLTKMAEKRKNGLAGITFETSRTGDKKPNVGDLFDQVGEHSMSEIEEHFKELSAPLDYAEETAAITHTSQELAQMGFVSGATSFGSHGASAADIDDSNKPW